MMDWKFPQSNQSEFPESSSGQSEIADEQGEPIQGLSGWEPGGSVQKLSARLVVPNTEGSRRAGQKKVKRI